MTDFDKGNYPPVSFYFRLSFSGIEGGSEIGFKEVSGISMETDLEEIAEGGGNRFVHKVPAAVKFSNLVLKRGLVPIDSMLVKWVDSTLESGMSQLISPKDITVSLLGENGKALKSWVFFNAWPVKWEVSNFNSMKNEVAIETLEFAYRYFKT